MKNLRRKTILNRNIMDVRHVLAEMKTIVRHKYRNWLNYTSVHWGMKPETVLQFKWQTVLRCQYFMRKQK